MNLHSDPDETNSSVHQRFVASRPAVFRIVVIFLLGMLCYTQVVRAQACLGNPSCSGIIWELIKIPSKIRRLEDAPIEGHLPEVNSQARRGRMSEEVKAMDGREQSPVYAVSHDPQKFERTSISGSKSQVRLQYFRTGNRSHFGELGWAEKAADGAPESN